MMCARGGKALWDFASPESSWRGSVEVGMQVKTGQVLARLDPKDQRLSAEAARQQLMAARSDLEQAKADLVRYKDLRVKGFISAAEYDRRKWAYRYGGRAPGADDRAARVESEPDRIHDVACRSEWRCYRGAGRSRTGGHGWTAGDQGGRLEEIEVAVSVPENRLGELRAANDVDITTVGRARQDLPRPYPRNLTQRRQRHPYLHCESHDTGSGRGLQLGMTANVFLKGERARAVARLPLTALFQNGSEPAVWRDRSRDAASGAQTGSGRPLYAGLRDGHRGLDNGDLVVRAGVHKLNQGETVRILADASALIDIERIAGAAP